MTLSPAEPRDARRGWIVLAVVVATMALTATVDQVTKALSLAHLSRTERIPLLGDFLGLQLAFNPGTVMSFGSGSTWVFTIISTLASIGIPIYAWRKVRSLGFAVAAGLVGGGAVGNLADRLFAEPGFGVGWVTDMLAYGNLFIGNLADVFIGVGAGLFVLLLVARAVRERRSGVVAREEPST